MSPLLEKLKKNSTIKDTSLLSESKFFNAKDMIQTSVPMLNVAFFNLLIKEKQMVDLANPFFKDFDKLFIGWDDTYNKLTKLHDDVTRNLPNYPPYNIKQVEENHYVVELALAGFAKQDIDVIFEEGKLTVSGKAADDNDNFIFKGIANRAFTRTFALDDTIEIKDAEMLNGMLKVFLEKIVPEHKKAKKIEVKDKAASVKDHFAKKELLTED